MIVNFMVSRGKVRQRYRYALFEIIIIVLLMLILGKQSNNSFTFPLLCFMIAQGVARQRYSRLEIRVIETICVLLVLKSVMWLHFMETPNDHPLVKIFVVCLRGYIPVPYVRLC